MIGLLTPPIFPRSFKIYLIYLFTVNSVLILSSFNLLSTAVKSQYLLQRWRPLPISRPHKAHTYVINQATRPTPSLAFSCRSIDSDRTSYDRTPRQKVATTPQSLQQTWLWSKIITLLRPPWRPLRWEVQRHAQRLIQSYLRRTVHRQSKVSRAGREHGHERRWPSSRKRRKSACDDHTFLHWP